MLFCFTGYKLKFDAFSRYKLQLPRLFGDNQKHWEGKEVLEPQLQLLLGDHMAITEMQEEEEILEMLDTKDLTRKKMLMEMMVEKILLLPMSAAMRSKQRDVEDGVELEFLSLLQPPTPMLDMRKMTLK